jgi:hypothetical protein
VLAWSERQREGVELEVGCLGVYQSKGEERGMGDTPEADRWGGGAVWVLVHAWREWWRGKRGVGEDLSKILHAWHRFSSSPSFLSIISNIAGAGVLLGVVLVNLLGRGARFSGKGFAPKIKEKKRKENHT